MPSALTHPGVYIEEVSSGVRTIVGVGTSIAAFVGYFKRGSMTSAIQVFNFSEFTREFGGLDRDCDASYAIQQFFQNGGTEAWVVRTAAAGSTRASAIALKETATAPNAVLRVSSRSPGEWGDNLRLIVDYDTPAPTQTFNLTVIEMIKSGGRFVPGTTEIFRNLVLDPSKSNDAAKVVNDASKLVQLDYPTQPTAGQRPAHTGTTSKGLLPAVLAGIVAADTMTVSLNGGPDLGSLSTVANPANVTALANDLGAKLRALKPELVNATVTVLGSASTEQYLRISPGTETIDDVLSFSGGLATKLGLDEARANVSQYALGGTANAAQALPSGARQQGSNGHPPTGADLSGDPLAKTGLFRLDDVDLFNLLCIPDTMNLPDGQAIDVAAKAETYCETRRAFYLLDPPKIPASDDLTAFKAWLDANATLRHKNAAVYFPRPRIADPLDEFRLRTVPSSGLMAGLYARTDTERGVWKAPAGTEATLRGVQALGRTLTDAENGTLNPKGINCLRRLPVHGNVSWGARTLMGADAQASEWKYIPVRRTALFIEESLFRGTQWVVFEPNDEPLWAQIRLNIGAFMHSLFRQGAFQGVTPREAYFVKCDSETTTQTDINSGIVNIVVGFAPLKPAEFVVIKLQQIAGEIAT